MWIYPYFMYGRYVRTYITQNIHTQNRELLTKATAVEFDSSLTVNTAKNDKLMVM